MILQCFPCVHKASITEVIVSSESLTKSGIWVQSPAGELFLKKVDMGMTDFCIEGCLLKIT